MKKKYPSRQCVECKHEFRPNRFNQLYCSPTCRQKHTNERNYINNPFRGINSATTGAISELRTAVDLMSKGYNVFRALSPACACDLAILKNDKLLRIEVRTSYKTRTGLIQTNHALPKGIVIDHFAWVAPDEIEYEPPLP